jgi:hypothetical protein
MYCRRALQNSLLRARSSKILKIRSSVQKKSSGDSWSEGSRISTVEDHSSTRCWELTIAFISTSTGSQLVALSAPLQQLCVLNSKFEIQKIQRSEVQRCRLHQRWQLKWKLSDPYCRRSRQHSLLLACRGVVLYSSRRRHLYSSLLHRRHLSSSSCIVCTSSPLFIVEWRNRYALVLMA